MSVEQILRIFGYKEKVKNAREVIRHACMLNMDAKERLEKVRATLNGEANWFLEDDKNGHPSE